MVHAIPVYDGGALSFVIGVDFSVASLNVLLEEATLSPSEGPVVFVMDTDGYLYATNDAGVEVVTNSQELAFAPNSSATRVSVSSTGALSGSYLVDSTFVVGSILTTVRRVDVAQLATPVRVLVSNNVTTDTASLAPQCDLIISRNVLTSAGGELEAFLVQAVRAVDFVSSLLSAGSIPSSSAAYRTLNSDAQLLVYGAVKQYVSTVGAAMYIGWPDDTFFLVNMNPSSSLGSYVSYKLSGDADRVYYAFDADTGRADVAGGVIYSKEYYPTERPWYVTAEEAGEGKYSAPFAFATGGSIGMTYAKPVYDAAGTLICIVAADFTLGALNTLLEPFNTGGEVVFGIDSITSELVAVSNGIDQVTTDEEGSNNVAVATSDITDYYVSKAAVAVQTTDSLDNGQVLHLTDMNATVRFFTQYSLDWTLVAATVTLTLEPTASLTSALSQKDFTVRTAATTLATFQSDSVTIEDSSKRTAITSQTLQVVNLDWTVVAVDAQVVSIAAIGAGVSTPTAESTCTLTIENDVAEATAYIVAEFMNRPVVAGQAVAYELSAIAETANLTASALAPTAQDSDLQKLLLRVVSAFGVRAAYVGFVDGTHIGVSVDEAGDYTGYFRSAGDDIDRATFPIDEDTGEQTSGTSLTYVSCFVLLNEWMRASQRLRLCSHLCVSASASLCVSACLSLCDESVHNIICI